MNWDSIMARNGAQGTFHYAVFDPMIYSNTKTTAAFAAAVALFVDQPIFPITPSTNQLNS